MKLNKLFSRQLWALIAGLCLSVGTKAQKTYGLGSPLISSVDQLKSPWTDSEEGALSNLIDGSIETYWHSSWHSYPPHDVQGSHYVQVTMPEGYYEMWQLIAFKFTRREVMNNHSILWSVWGTNIDNSSAPLYDKEECEKLALVETPFTSNTETLTSTPFDPKGYKYLRFYSEEQYPESKVLWHMSEFQIYSVLEITAIEAKRNELLTLCDEYDDEYSFFVSHSGVKPGMYEVTAVDNLGKLLTSARSYLNSSNNTIDGLQQKLDSLNSVYEIAVNSKVPFVLPEMLPDGYYRIRGGLKYTNLLPTGVDAQGNPITELVEGLDKYMYSTVKNGQILAMWNTPDDLTTDCPSLWKISNVDGKLDIVNCATNARFSEVKTSGSVLMQKDSIVLNSIDIVTNYEGCPYFNIYIASQKGDIDSGSFYEYLHQADHEQGSGISGNIVGWTVTYDRKKDNLGVNPCGASEWTFDPVPEQEAERIITNYDNSHEIMVDSFEFMMNDAKEKLQIAKDFSIVIEENSPIVSETNPLTSPCSDSVEGLHIEYLWDGDGNTWWHSDWHGNYNIEDHHYIQVAIPSNLTEAVFQIQRRNTTSNQINKWSIYGTNKNDFSLVQADLVKIADVTTTYHKGNNTEIILSPCFETKGYKYLRFYCEGTCNNDGSQSKNNTFFHLAEFQLYPGHYDESQNAQYKQLGDIAINLETVVEALNDIDPRTITLSQYETLKHAYDDFNARFVNPMPLREKIKEVKDVASIIEIGAQPGFWADRSAGEALERQIEEAKTYDGTGSYTAEQSAYYLRSIDELVQQIYSSVIPIQPSKWYRLRFGTEDEFSKHGWPKDGNDTIYYRFNGENTEIVIDEAIWGKYMTVATSEDYERIDEDDNYVTCHRVVPISKDRVGIDNKLFFDDSKDIVNVDMSLFRFIPMNDGYAIQNKATGLYLQKKPESSDIFLSVHPSIFLPKLVGHGQYAFFIQTLLGEQQNPLHFARNHNMVTTWPSYGDAVSRRGCLFIEEVENVSVNYSANIARISLAPGELTARCYPVTMQCTDLAAGQMWTVAAIKRLENHNTGEEEVRVILTKLEGNTASAGQPFIFIANGKYNTSNTPVLIPFKYSSDFTSVPMNNGYLKGTFTNLNVGTGVLVEQSDSLVLTTLHDANLETNRAYVVGEEPFNKDATIVVITDENSEYMETQQNYQRALQAIQDGDPYSIYTEIKGKRYYLTTEGQLTSSRTAAGSFIFSKVQGEEYEFGFNLLDSYFTNPDLDSDGNVILNSGQIHRNTKSKRAEWEAQVFLKDSLGNYAIRATNAIGGEQSWAHTAKTYWTVNVTEEGPLAEYSFEKKYLWKLIHNKLVELTLNLMVDGEVVATETQYQSVGLTPQAPSSFTELFHGLYTLVPDVNVISSETSVVNFSPVWIGPFEFSSDIDNAKWYNMTIRDKYYVAMDEEEPYIPSIEKELVSMASQWAFFRVENEPFQIIIYNRSAGKGQTLSVDNETEYVVMREGQFLWEVFANDDGFVIRPVNGGENDWVNQKGGQDGALGLWKSSWGRTDAGSTLRVELVDGYEFQAEQPQFSIDEITKRISITSSTVGAKIYYTTDGSTPTSKSTLYSNPFAMKLNGTVKAIAQLQSYPCSAVSALTVDWNRCGNPQFAKISSSVIRISTSTSGATIHYTTDNTVPTEDSPIYNASERISVSQNCTIRAFASADKLLNSDTLSYEVNWFTVEDVLLTLGDDDLLSMETSTEDAVIYYTTDGSEPNENSLQYIEPISLVGVSIVKIIAMRDGYNSSSRINYTVLPRCSMPVLTRNGNQLSMSSAIEGVDIYYSIIDSSTMGGSYSLYEAPITLNHNCVIKVYATKDGFTRSVISVYEVTDFKTATPTFTADQNKLVISCPQTATIYYVYGQDDTPTLSSLTYQDPIDMENERYVRAIAIAEDFQPSEIVIFDKQTITCNEPVITFNGRDVSIKVTDEDAQIYYTMDSLVPTTSSSIYDGIITLTGLVTLKMMSVKEGYFYSPVVTFETPYFFDGQKAILPTAGCLSEALGGCVKENVKTLAVNGKMNGEDYQTIRSQLTSLQRLDLTALDNALLPDGAFEGMTSLISVSLPKQMEQVGSDLFKNCPNLSAITWSASAAIPATMLSESQNPNLLLYAPMSLWTVNVPTTIRNKVHEGVAKSITLTDGYPFYCPQEFIAEQISYTHEYTQQTVIGKCQGWETIALPFTVQTITHEDEMKGEMVPFAANNVSASPFWLYRMSENGNKFAPAESIEANTPYIISMPNNPDYADRYNLAGKVTFSAKNATVEASSALNIVRRDGGSYQVEFVPCFAVIPQENNILTINHDEAWQDNPQGSIFRSHRAVQPFEAYIQLSVGAGVKEFHIADDDATDIREVEMKTIRNVENETIYDLGGRLVSGGHRQTEYLRPGVYIHQGRKILVK